MPLQNRAQRFATLARKCYKRCGHGQSLKNAPFSMILFATESLLERSSCSKKSWSNGKTNSPSRARLVNCTFFAKHQSGTAWAIGIPCFFWQRKMHHKMAHIASISERQKCFVFSLQSLRKRRCTKKIFRMHHGRFSWCKSHQTGSIFAASPSFT